MQVLSGACTRLCTKKKERVESLQSTLGFAGYFAIESEA
jgi:hypothetical protein